MRVSILATDSRGVIQPLVALAQKLKRNHVVRFVTHERFRNFIDDNGLEFRPLPDQPRGRWGSEEAAQLTMRLRVKYTLNLARHFIGGSSGRPLQREQSEPSYMEQLWNASWEACRDSDAMIFVWTSIWGCIIAEKLQVPAICAGFFPMTRTREFPHFGLYHVSRRWPLGGWFNRLSYDVFDRASWNFARGASLDFRQGLGLPPLPAKVKDYRPYQEMLVLYGISPQVLPRPEDWPAHHQLSGYWHLHSDHDWQPAPELREFLAAGPPPVCAGFGSMTGGDTAGLTDTVVRALQRAGQRGLLLTGWGGMENKSLPSGFLAIKEAPHDWLFPQTAAVIHHGGCGTTGAALTAGVPSIVTPWFGGDQPFWADRVIRLGCGPRAASKGRWMRAAR